MADNQQYGPLAPKKTSASDIRSVIANATKETGKGFTIANKEEIEQKKQDNGLNVKVSNGVKTNPKVELTNNTKPTSVINTPTQKKEAPTGPVVSPVVSASQLTGDVFKNPQLQPIKNIKVQKNNDEPKLSNSYTNYHLNKDEIRNMLVESQEDKIKRKSEGIEKLYIDAYRKKKNGEVLTIEEVLGNANYQKELNGIEQGKLQEMINDANAIANAGKFNMDNVIPLFEKYQDEGIQVDYNKLSPQSKAQFVGDMLNNKQSTIGKIISLGTPLGQINSLKELITGKSFLDDIQDAIIDLEKTSHKNLTDKEADKIASKQIKELDEGFKDFYDMGKKSPSLIDYVTNIEDAPKMYYENKYGVAKDQKIWKDKDKEREYNEKLDEIRRLVKEQHGDTPENVAKNTLIGSAKALLTVYNMASDLPGFGKMIFDLGGGGIEDFVGSAVSLGKTAYDTAKYGAETGDFEVQWDAKDIRQRVAESGGYDNYKDMVAKLEKEWGDNPLGQFAVWSLKNADTSMDTANALGNYFMEKYGSLDKGWTAFKNDPVEVISDWMPAMQFKVSLLNKLGFISDLNATKILNASRWLDAYDKPFELANKLQFGPLLKAEGKLLGGISKLGLNSIKLPVKAVASITDAVISKLTGIDKESRNYIRENGDAVLDYVNGKETSDGILREITDKFDELTDEKKQIGEEYNIIKESDVPVNSKSVMDDIYSKLSEYGVKINTDGSVEFSKILPTSIKGKVNELVSYINDFQKKGDKPSASDTHYFRQLVDNLTNWDNPNPKGLDAQFINTLKDIRKTIDGALKEQVPGMKEADAAYSKTVSLIQELKKDWFNKDGTLKDGAYSKIRNLTNKGSNQPKLERLEKIIPGITGKLKSLAVSEVIERGMKQATGQYLNQLGLGGSVFSLFTGGVSLTPMVLGILGANLATPKNFAHLLRFEGKVTKPIRNLADKIKNGIKLNAKETKDLVDFMLDNKEGLKETAKYMNERGLFDEPNKASDTKAPKSKDPTLKELTDYKESLKKDLKEGKITKEYYDDEIHGKNGEPGIDYAIAQKKARVKAGDKEHVLSAEDKERVTNFIKKRAKDVGFVTEMFENLPFDAGFTHLRNKLIAFSKNPGDTTAKHELFHAFFSVCDNKTKTYLIQEARKILKDNGMAIKDAEEWLAESFGIYAKRKMIDLGMIKNAPKGFVDKLRNFFQKVYEYIQKFNGDRATINKIFDEVLGEKQMKDGIMDLSDLIGDKKLDKKLLREIELGDNGLRNKAVYHGSPADFDKFDSSHMGEGEGAQAHGWGHYVAVEERTGRHYADMGRDGKYSYKGKHVDNLDSKYGSNNVEESVASFVIKNLENGKTFEEAKKNLIKNWTDGGYDKTKELEALSKMNEGDFKKLSRNLYELDIPDPRKADTPTGSNYWEEDAMLGKKEIDKLADALDKYADKNKGKFEYIGRMRYEPDAMDLQYYDIKEDAKLIRNANTAKGKVLFSHLEDLFGKKGASKFLEYIGYDGIHYFGGRDGEAYVIFNDDALQIKEHIRYKKKIGDKEVEINKDITSPDQMAKVNSKGLSVIHDFISEKQAEKALNVNKALLDKDGNAYLWTHTNKYGDNPITNFENVKDSKYKGYEGKEIAWFTNNADMSKSYAGQKSKLANTKAPRTEEEFNKWLNDKTKELQKEYGGQVFGKDEKLSFTVKEGKNGYYIEREIKNNNEVMDKDKFRSWVAMWQGLTMSDLEKKEKNLGGLEGLMKSQEDRLKNNGYANVDFKIDGDNVILNYSEIYKATPEFKDKKEFYAKSFSSFQGKNYYHYQGIIQDMKKPLVVDFGEERYWNDLGKVSDMLTENQHKSLVASSHGRQFYTQKVLDFIHEITAVADEYEAKQGGKYYSPTLKDNFFRILRDDISFLNTDGIKELINNYDTIIDDALEFDRSKGNFDGLQTFRDVAEHSIELIEENRPQLEKALFKNVAEELKAVGGEWLVNHYKEQFGLNANELLLNQEHFRDALHDRLETNDWVKYALSKGEYDGVIFKNVRDYGGAADKNTPGDVVAAFNSKQFKAWDNANPTDSKYISYKKKVSLDKKPEGLSKKDSNGLLAKGRERMGDNGMRYKAAWHGSPTQFDRFDSSHMGEGEGNQAHGWGHYVAVDRKTAEKYASMQKLKNMKLDGKNIEAWIDEYEKKGGDAISLTNPKLYARARVSKNLMMGDGLATAKSMAKDRAERYLESIKGTETEIDGKKYIQSPNGLYPKDVWEKTVKLYENQIKAIDEITPEMYNDGVKGNRNLYELDIPDPIKKDTPTGSNYLEESGKLTREQANEIMNKAEEDRYGGLKDFKDADLEDARKIANEVFADLSDKQKKISVDEFVHDVEMMADEMDISDAIDKELEYHAYLTSTMREWKNKAGLFDKGDYATIHNGKDLYNELSYLYGSEKEASKFLEKLGYDGIHYFGGQDGEAYVLFNDNSPKIKNSIRYKKKGEDDNKMIAIHNTSLEKLAKSKELGGLVAPSVAITKKGIPFENYGEISFIGNKKLVNPTNDVLVGETDLYSPRVPHPTIEWKEGFGREKQEALAKKLGMRWTELNEYVYNGGDTYYERSYPNLAKEIAPYINKKLFKGFTDMGDRIYEPYDMKHIIKEMFKDGDVGSESALFGGNYSEAMARMSDSVKDLENVRGRIGNKKGLEDKYKKLEDKYTNEAWDLLGGRDGMAMFTEMIKEPNWKIVNELADYDIDITEKQVQKLKDLVKKGFDLPKSYVEAKIKRGVGFDEFSAVVVPEDKVAEVRKLVGDNIKVVGYKDGERMATIDKVADDNGLRFKKKVDQTQTPEFKKWFEGSKVVDKEGKPLEVYHGSTATFNVFDKNKIGKNAKKVGPGFYFTDVKAEADAYQKHYNALKDKYENYEVDKPRTISAYLDIKNPIRIGEDVLSKEQMVKILNQGDYEWAFNNWLPGKIESINELNIKKINGKSYTPEEVRNMSKEQKIDLYVDKLIQDSRGKDDLMLKFLEEVSQVYHYDNKGRVLDVLKDVTGNDGVIYEQVSKWNPDRKYPTQYVAWESNQIKSATDNIGTFDKNNPDIRYKKGLEKKSDDGIRYKGNSLPVHKLGDVGLENEYGLKKIEGNKPYKLTNGTRQEMEKGLNKIMRNLRNDAVAGGVVPGNYNKGTPIENALNSLRKINWDKENIEDIETLRGVWRGKDYSIAQIIKLIDSGNGDGMRYRWYWDKKEGMPTVIFWKGNQYKAIGDKKYWAFHTNKNNITSPTMQSSLNNKGKLRPSPLRR